MRSSRLWGPAVLLAAACGSTTPAKAPDALYKSGSRLRARFTDAGGGARRFDGWWDTKLATPCALRFAEDGVQRCVPMADSVGSSPAYADPGCTVPVVTYVDPNQQAPYLAFSGAMVSAPVVCGADLATLAAPQSGGYLVSSWHIVGGAQPSPPTLYALDASGGCTQTGTASGTVVYPLERVAPAELVATTGTRVDPRGASLAIQIFDADDGSSTAGALFDVASVRGCFPSWVIGVTDDYRCYSGSLDASCNPGSPGSCEGDLFAGNLDFCTLPPLARLGNGTCDLVDAARIPELASDLLGTGRVRLAITHAADDARPLLVNPNLFESDGRYIRGPFVDTARQMACDPTALEDGSVRCLTQDVIDASTYTDAACTHLVALKLGFEDSCSRHSQPPTPRFAVGRSPVRLYELGAEVHLAEEYSLNAYASPPSCDLQSAPVDAYELTPADPSIFASLEVGTE